MTRNGTRGMISSAAIAVAALLGVRLLWISPAHARAQAGLDRIEASRDESQRRVDAAATAPAQRDDARRADAQAEVIRRASRASGSESGVFATLETLAVRTGVHLEQVRPQRVEHAGPERADDEATETPNMDAQFKTTVTVHGTYEGVTRFMASIARHEWYVGVGSAMIVRRDSRSVDRVIATLELDHVGPELAPTASHGGDE